MGGDTGLGRGEHEFVRLVSILLATSSSSVPTCVCSKSCAWYSCACRVGGNVKVWVWRARVCHIQQSIVWARGLTIDPSTCDCGGERLLTVRMSVCVCAHTLPKGV